MEVGFTSFVGMMVWFTLSWSPEVGFMSLSRGQGGPIQCRTVNNSSRNKGMVGWLLGFYDSTRDKDDTTVGVGHSRRYCNTRV